MEWEIPAVQQQQFAGYAERVKTAALHTHLLGVRGTSKVTWVRVAYPWSCSASSGFTMPGPLCTADEVAYWGALRTPRNSSNPA